MMKCFYAVLLLAGVCQAAVVPNGLFTDHMVLQRNQDVRVYGTADEDEKVSVSFNGQTRSTRAINGAWEVVLKPMKHGGPYSMTIKGNNKVILKDILIGDVWVLGGQSNMARTMKSFKWLMECKPAMEENDEIRLFCMDSKTHAEQPSKKIVTHRDFNGSWQYCTREYLDNFSPLGYFFAIHRYKMNQVPLGIIYACRGATSVNSWVDRSILESDPAYAFFLDEAENKNCRPKNGEPNPMRPSALYNGIIYPLMPFSIKGVMWNQGESDSKWAEVYKTLFPAMIRNWRKTWGQGNFPFVYAQVSSNKDRTWALIKNPREDSWAWQREAQSAALKKPNTAMVAAYDLGEWDDIHPQDKESLAKRYVLAAAKLNGEEVIASGPTYKDYRIEGNKVIIRFENLHEGLVTRRVSMNKNKGLAPGTDPEAYVASSDQLTGFILCGEDQKFHDAEAKIEGNTVVVTCPQVSKPVAARYAWATFALANLYNQAGHPAFPFRTDSFERPRPYVRIKK